MHVHGFYELLDGAEEGSETWTALVAGLAVLRVVCTSLTSDIVAPAQRSLALETVGAVPDITLRGLFDAVLSTAMGAFPLDERAHLLAGRIFSYAKMLQNAGQWQAAADVAAFAAEIAKSVKDFELAAQSLMQEGHSHRRLSRFDRAETAYAKVRAAARMGKLPQHQLDADFGEACIALERNDLALATAKLDALIVDATIANDHHRLGLALSARGAAAGQAGDHAAVLSIGRDTLRVLSDPRNREIVLKNMATAFRETGEAEAAMVLAQWLRRRAVERERRYMASILLMHLYTDRGQVARFVELAHELGVEPMAPRVTIEYLEALARGLAAGNDFGRAEQAVNRMIRLARDHDQRAQLERAVRARADIAEERVPAIYEFRPASLAPDAKQLVRTIADAAHELLNG